MEVPSVRVLVVGDSGVGKTALLRAACRDPSAPVVRGAPQWTTGCDVHVMYHQYHEGYGVEKEVVVEFLDVGGHPKYEISRSVFYHDIQGVIFVYDLSNARSYDHLKIWQAELALAQRSTGCVLSSFAVSNRSNEFPSLHALPKLVIGNKRDVVGPKTKRALLHQPELRDMDATEACAEPFALDPTIFRHFLDRVVQFANATTTSDNTNTNTNTFRAQSPFRSDGLRRQSKSNTPSSTNPNNTSW